MSNSIRNPSNISSRVIGYLRQMSSDKEEESGPEGLLRSLTVKGYARVPYRGSVSASTTSTSLATDYGEPHTQHSLPRAHFPPEDYTDGYLEEYLEEEEVLEDEESQVFTHIDGEEDFEKIRLHLQQLRQASLGQSNKYKMEMEIKGIKEENLRTVVPHLEILLPSKKIKDSYGMDCPTYRPTSQRIQIKNQILAAVAVSLGSLVVGFSTGFTSPALPSMKDGTAMIDITAEESTWVGGLMPLAALAGGLLGGPLIELLGRKMTLIAISIPFSISYLIMALAPNVPIILLGRALGGICVGIGSLSFPVYLGEVIQPDIRGQLGLMPTAFGNIGILIVYIAGKYVEWVELSFLGATLPIPFLIMMLLIPETPRWLLTHRGEADAIRSLQWFRGRYADVKEEMGSIIVSQNSGQKARFTEIFNRKYANPMMISLCMMFFQQMSGINAVMFYVTEIFKESGSTIHEKDGTIIIGVVNFVSTLVSAVLIEKLGRKLLMYISGVTMIVTLTVLSTYFYLQTFMDVSFIGWIPLVTLTMYVIGFSLGLGPIPWLMMGEIIPNRIRGTGGAIITAFSWTCTFIVTKMFVNISGIIGKHGVFTLFCVFCILGLINTILFVPETKGISLEELEKKLTASSSNDSRSEDSSDYEKRTSPINC